MSDRAQPGYRTWQQRVRSRALKRLTKLHAAEQRAVRVGKLAPARA